jgi:hypothetical protein
MSQNILIYAFRNFNIFNKYITDIIMNPTKTYLDLLLIHCRPLKLIKDIFENYTQYN